MNRAPGMLPSRERWLSDLMSISSAPRRAAASASSGESRSSWARASPSNWSIVVGVSDTTRAYPEPDGRRQPGRERSRLSAG
jgi:hypothetical protein